MTTLRITDYGTLSTGERITQAILTAGNGLTVGVISFGGIITHIETPDRDGRMANVALGFADLPSYEAYNGYCHFGAVIGRFANRIAQGRFTLDGRTHQLPINNGPNALHGGPNGFGRRVWTLAPQGDDAVTLSLVSPDGEAGFPGTLQLRVTYRLSDDGALRIDYEASTDAPTIINLTNHSYFNLAGNGSGSIEGHVARIEADHFTPVDENLIPTGAIASVDGTPLDFRSATSIGARLREAHPQVTLARGYDHNWVIRPGAPGELAEAACVHDPASGRAVTCLTTHPGLQFYTGNFLDGTKCGSAGTLYRQTDGFTLETQHFPDSPNQPAFPSTVLRPGQTYRHSTEFRFHTV
jgi:aldose 1-epimerase